MIVAIAYMLEGARVGFLTCCLHRAGNGTVRERIGLLARRRRRRHWLIRLLANALPDVNLRLPRGQQDRADHVIQMNERKADIAIAEDEPPFTLFPGNGAGHQWNAPAEDLAGAKNDSGDRAFAALLRHQSFGLELGARVGTSVVGA